MKNTNNTNTINRSDLSSRILRQYASLEDFADRTGVALAALTGKKEFILEDIRTIVAALGLSHEEAKKIFFPGMEPKEDRHTMIDLLAMRDTIERLENIESGLTALNLMVTGQVQAVGDTIAPEDFRNAFSFLSDELMDRVMDLRASLTATYFQERGRIGQ